MRRWLESRAQVRPLQRRTRCAQSHASSCQVAEGWKRLAVAFEAEGGEVEAVDRLLNCAADMCREEHVFGGLRVCRPGGGVAHQSQLQRAERGEAAVLVVEARRLLDAVVPSGVCERGGGIDV